MTLCNNLSRKRGVGVFSRVGVFLRDYGTQTADHAKPPFYDTAIPSVHSRGDEIVE